MVDSVEIETCNWYRYELDICPVEEVWWTLSRLKPLHADFHPLMNRVEEVWWTLSRLKPLVEIALS